MLCNAHPTRLMRLVELVKARLKKAFTVVNRLRHNYSCFAIWFATNEAMVTAAEIKPARSFASKAIPNSLRDMGERAESCTEAVSSLHA